MQRRSKKDFQESRRLLTITTPKGLFVFNRLPFGVQCAPGIFQQVLDSMITGLSGTAAYLDDIAYHKLDTTSI